MMKRNSYFKLKSAGLIFLSLFLITLFLPSCDKEEADKGTPYFTIEGNPTGLTVGIAGVSQKYTVRSNRPWKIVAKTTTDWARAFPDEGDDDGIFQIIVKENTTFVDRTMDFAFVVDGVEQPVLFRVDQEKAVPSLVVSDVPAGKNINQVAQNVKINVKANVAYTYSSDATWFTFVGEQAVQSGTDMTFAATSNEGINSRIANVSFTCAEFPALNVTLTVTQEGKGEGTIVLYESFSWLNYGSAIFYTTTGETRYDSWTQAEKDMGWTSTLNPGSNDTPLYARPGMVKLGKTSYGGDLISPKLTAIVGTQNLLVKFKAVPYQTAAGTRDDNILKISIIGPGTISVSSFTIDNWPNYTTDPTCTAIWADPATERTFTITGATADTQIKFLGGDYLLLGVGAGKNRIFIDEIKVLIPN